jgi:CPA1 family monovalent cation:H+ antiporter
MPAVELILVLLVAVVVLAMVARRIHLPYPIVLVLGGLALGFVPGMPRVALQPEIVFLVFLPPLLFKSAWFTSARDFRAALRSISLLAFGLVICTTLGVAWVAHTVIPGLPWPTAFVIGAVVSPTDAVAATAIMQRLGAPRRVITVVEGESLLNDATGLVVYRFAVAAAATGVFVLWQAGLQFVLVSAGGIAVGLAVGWILAQIQLRMEDPLIEITLTFLASYGAYLAAESLHLSGVLAVVAAGLYVGRRSPELLSPSSRQQGQAVWSMAAFVLNGLAFILIGLQLPTIARTLAGRPVPDLILYAGAVSLAVIVIRILWTFPGAYLPFLIPYVRRHELFPPARNVTVVAWSGMRGAVSLAAALALPATIPGGPWFGDGGGKDLVLYLTFSVILVTLVLQGLSLPAVLRLLRVTGDGGEEREEKIARLRSIEAAELRLEELATTEWAHDEQVGYLRNYYKKRRSTVETRFGVIRHDHQNGADGQLHHEHADGADHLADHRERQESMRRLRLDILATERNEIVRLRNDGTISDQVLHRIERDLDLEELRLAEAPAV